jgi:K+-transporting ATPase KdpF subunit
MDWTDCEECEMNLLYAAGGLLVLALLSYLFYALLKPEALQ